MLQPNVLRWEEIETTDGKKQCNAQIECSACGLPFMFRFNLADAEITAKYMSHELAKGYIDRCAPLKCATCTIQNL